MRYLAIIAFMLSLSGCVTEQMRATENMKSCKLLCKNHVAAYSDDTISCSCVIEHGSEIGK